MKRSQLLPLALALLAAATTARAEEPKTSDPTTSPTPQYASADALLEELESADESISTLSANIVYDRIFMLQGDRHVRYGKLYFDVHEMPEDQPPYRTFAIHFEKLVLDGAVRDDKQAWIFDGRWLVEKRFVEKQYVAREIARPGTQIDPLRLGEGPLPIPIGQRKQDILDRYTAQLVPWDDAFDPEDPSHVGYMKYVRNASQIVLEPLPHRRNSDDFRSIRLWYAHNDEGLLLPVLSRTLDRKGDESFVLLKNTLINEPIPLDLINIDQPPPGQGWNIQAEQWRNGDEPEPSQTTTPQAD